MIGLTSVKEDVIKTLAMVKMANARKKAGLKAVPVSMHLVFTGNPGTGKTTVAEIIGELYKEANVLSKGHVVKAERQNLVGKYVGHTAVQTREMIEKALGGILFIDEAYRLVGEGNDYGQEAIDTLLTAMEEYRDDFVVIVAGYTDRMSQFLDSNPGLRSRFNRFIDFPDYTSEELIEIFIKYCNDYDYRLTEDALEYIKERLTRLPEEEGKEFANARSVRNYFERVYSRLSLRMLSKSVQDISLIIRDDVYE